ncbi:unnamed protein product [Periconia digitata]|uniref:Uncharacterized protein n=1 Tax=Periconia digitata TaxID=1303443 RepID=A0A9W4U165_9PLEO|nr:unnamed protein product [Periconia digitata]
MSGQQERHHRFRRWKNRSDPPSASSTSSTYESPPSDRTRNRLVKPAPEQVEPHSRPHRPDVDHATDFVDDDAGRMSHSDQHPGPETKDFYSPRSPTPGQGVNREARVDIRRVDERHRARNSVPQPYREDSGRRADARHRARDYSPQRYDENEPRRSERNHHNPESTRPGRDARISDEYNGRAMPQRHEGRLQGEVSNPQRHGDVVRSRNTPSNRESSLHRADNEVHRESGISRNQRRETAAREPVRQDTPSTAGSQQSPPATTTPEPENVATSQPNTENGSNALLYRLGETALNSSETHQTLRVAIGAAATVALFSNPLTAVVAGAAVAGTAWAYYQRPTGSVAFEFEDPNRGRFRGVVTPEPVSSPRQLMDRSFRNDRLIEQPSSRPRRIRNR